jgi:phosphate transport system substrate-binding protein
MITKNTLFAVAVASLLALSGCGKKEEGARKGEGGAVPAGSTIQIDGSSTVYPISEAVAEEYQARHGGRVTIGVSGTGGGFKKFCRGEIALSGASRPIKPSENAACKSAGIEFIELPVAYDGLAVVVHKNNTWVDHMTTDELKTMWAPESKGTITRWSQVREGWPDDEFRLFGPGTDSGTYDYFTLAINGKEQASRSDFMPNEDDNVLVQGISGDKNALGYFGYAYYKDNADKLKLVPIDDGKADNGEGAILPSVETVAGGTYQPLSRPIFIYVNKKEADRPEVQQFVEFYLEKGFSLVEEVGYIPLPEKAYELARQRFRKRTMDSVFGEGSEVGVTVEALLESSGQ